MPPAPIEIRDARPADLEAIITIYNHEVSEGTSTFDTVPLDVDRDLDWLTRREARHPVLVAETGDTIAGWGALSRFSPKRGYDRTAEVSVYVHRDHRRRGLGRALLSALIERAPAGDVAVLLARIAGENPISIELHESLGFELIGIQRRCGEKLGRVLDVALLDLHLD